MAELPLVGDEFAGYRMRAVLGRGGMSVVYQAENLRLSSVIALKVLAPELASDDVFRARFRNSFEQPAALVPSQVTPYAIDLHGADYTFLKGHRVMVQVQSTWFPLIDRNPQRFVPNIFLAKDSDYISATHRVYRSAQ